MSDGAKLAAAVGLMAVGGLAAWWIAKPAAVGQKTAGGPGIQTKIEPTGRNTEGLHRIGDMAHIGGANYVFKALPAARVHGLTVKFDQNAYYAPGTIVDIGGASYEVKFVPFTDKLAPIVHSV